jgi:hypothetical protein
MISLNGKKFSHNENTRPKSGGGGIAEREFLIFPHRHKEKLKRGKGGE